MNIHDTIFSPLIDKKYCMWYYIFMVLSFIFSALMLMGAIVTLVTSKSDENYIEHFTVCVSVALNFFVIYFMHRLIYSMCIRSLV